jgi:hypothetical protein
MVGAVERMVLPNTIMFQSKRSHQQVTIMNIKVIDQPREGGYLRCLEERLVRNQAHGECGKRRDGKQGKWGQKAP